MSDIGTFVSETLKHEAKNAALFELAFTHSSVGRESYERLEFLGDRVLGMVIARTLYERYPKEPGDSDFVYKQTIKAKACDGSGRTRRARS